MSDDPWNYGTRESSPAVDDNGGASEAQIGDGSGTSTAVIVIMVSLAALALLYWIPPLWWAALVLLGAGLLVSVIVGPLKGRVSLSEWPGKVVLGVVSVIIGAIVVAVVVVGNQTL